MQEMTTLNHIIKILSKKLLIIIFVALIAAVMLNSVMDKNTAPEYEMKIYGIINYDYNRIEPAIINTIHDIYNLDLIEYLHEELKRNKAYNNYISDTELASDIAKNYKNEFNETSRVFNISYIGQDATSARYIAQYIFTRGAELVKLHTKNINIEQIDKKLDKIEYGDQSVIFNNIGLRFIFCFITSFVLIILCYVFKIIMSGKLYCSNQFYANYNLKILSVIKNKTFSTEELKTLLLFLKKENKKEIVFLSSDNYDNYNLLRYLKAVSEKDGYSTAIVDASIKRVKRNNVFYYDNEMSIDDKKRFIDKLNDYDHIFIKADSILLSYSTAELILKYKSVILIEKCGKSKYETINKTLDKITQFNGEVEGLIIIE